MALRITNAHTLPPHTHDKTWSAVAHCPACMTLGTVNPDTGSVWPRLDDHGEQVLVDAERRFNDRYDGTNHEASLNAAVTEAYLRGRMQGRMDEAKEAALTANASLRNAAEHLQHALDAAKAGDVASANSHTSLAAWHTAAATTYRAVAGSRA